MKWSLRRLLVLLLVLVTPAVAMAQPAQKPADTSTISETHITAALDLLDAVHATNNFQAMLDAVVPLETQQIKRVAPSLDDETVALIEKKLRDAVTARQGELMRIEAIEYARVFNEQELHDIAAFYRSELGQKYVTSIPSILRETAPIIQQWMKNVVEQVQQDIMRSLPQTSPNKS